MNKQNDIDRGFGSIDCSSAVVGIGNASVQLSIDRIKTSKPHHDTFNPEVLYNDAIKVVEFLEAMHATAANTVASIDNWRNVQPANTQVMQDVELLRKFTEFKK